MTTTIIEKLLAGAEVEWKPLGEVALLEKGNIITAKSKIDGDIPVIAGGRAVAYYNGNFNRTGKTITISGSGAYAGHIMYWEIPIFVSDAFSIKANLRSLNIRYLFHFLLQKQIRIYNLKRGAGVPHVYLHDVAKILIPIPPLSVQKEIVRILDAFTAHTAELTAELTERQKQYNYYRDKLLTFSDDEVEWKTLGEILNLRAGRHISAMKIKENADKEFIHPCFGGNGIRGFCKEKSHDGEYLIIGRQGALCGNVQKIKGKFYATEHAVVGSAIEAINIDWVFHVLTHMNLNQYATKSAQPGLSVGKLRNLKIPVPPMKRQKYVASILDKFEALTTSITEGLPRDIELRNKKYEYYRDHLLNFPKPEEKAEKQNACELVR